VMDSRLRFVFFFFQAEDGIRDLTVTGVQTCALPILMVLSGLVVLGIVGLIVAELMQGSALAWQKFGIHFFFGSEWDPVSGAFGRSEERRVGKECRSRWSPYH